LLLPALAAVARIVVKERCPNERKVAETVVISVESVESVEVVDAVAENAAAGDGCADTVISARYGYTSAGDHAPSETTAAETTPAMESTAATETTPAMESTAATETTPTVPTAATAAAAGQGRR
jgi:hypothetical protein